MNISEGQTGNFSLETVNPESSQSPSELQIEDQITTSREKNPVRNFLEELATVGKKVGTSCTLQPPISLSTALPHSSLVDNT